MTFALKHDKLGYSLEENRRRIMIFFGMQTKLEL